MTNQALIDLEKELRSNQLVWGVLYLMGAHIGLFLIFVLLILLLLVVLLLLLLGFVVLAADVQKLLHLQHITGT